ncbi:hypothetical protein APHNP_0280 [Anaplasma phagocytophilum str. ApNP]|uniref:Uncharacterized protein n=1 Tax=Anaplasma phagocytophilum str. ApNP TaxID=1359153 RepID=A0A0F3NF72_ANAPH|nr:hypothetical protein APHNP_0280 [Anaplasma phagocytophilum str. ApNP]SBO30376.1 hypothetical protein ANAPC3_00183 [Anaplasma phagocytophilum]
MYAYPKFLNKFCRVLRNIRRSVVDLIYINPDAELSPSTMQHIQPSCFAALPSFKPYHTSHPPIAPGTASR